MCMPRFTAALFTIARTWKQAGRPSTDEWIKMWYVYTVEYYAAIKGTKLGHVQASRSAEMDCLC